MGVDPAMHWCTCYFHSISHNLIKQTIINWLQQQSYTSYIIKQVLFFKMEHILSRRPLWPPLCSHKAATCILHLVSGKTKTKLSVSDRRHVWPPICSQSDKAATCILQTSSFGKKNIKKAKCIRFSRRPLQQSGLPSVVRSKRPICVLATVALHRNREFYSLSNCNSGWQ